MEIHAFMSIPMDRLIGGDVVTIDGDVIYLCDVSRAGRTAMATMCRVQSDGGPGESFRVGHVTFAWCSGHEWGGSRRPA